jgi:hypothetical protein
MIINTNISLNIVDHIEQGLCSKCGSSQIVVGYPDSFIHIMNTCFDLEMKTDIIYYFNTENIAKQLILLCLRKRDIVKLFKNTSYEFSYKKDKCVHCGHEQHNPYLAALNSQLFLFIEGERYKFETNSVSKALNYDASIFLNSDKRDEIVTLVLSRKDNTALLQRDDIRTIIKYFATGIGGGIEYLDYFIKLSVDALFVYFINILLDKSVKEAKKALKKLNINRFISRQLKNIDIDKIKEDSDSIARIISKLPRNKQEKIIRMLTNEYVEQRRNDLLERSIPNK